MNELYTVWFPQGTAGTFFIYFISLHSNFYHYTLQYLHWLYGHRANSNITKHPVHCQLYNHNKTKIVYAWWKIKKKNGIQIKQNLPDMNDNYPPLQLKDFLYQFKIDHADTINSKKLIFKQVSHKDPNSVIDDNKFLKNIVFFNTNDDYTWADNRNKKNINSLNDFVRFEIQKTYNHKAITKKLKEHECKYTLINIYKLLKLNDNEYKKLLNFINEEPLNNWKSIIDEFKKTIQFYV